MPRQSPSPRRATLARVAPLLLALACAAPAREPAARHPDAGLGAAVDSVRLLRDLSVLADDSMQGRLAGSPGGARARAYLVRRFREVGLAPLFDSLVQPVPVPESGRARVGPLPLANVVGVVRGTRHPERFLVVTAHYDHVGVGRPVNGDSIYNGADDNASGAAALIAIATDLVRHPPETSVIVAALDAEERGGFGAKALVSALRGRDVVLDLNADMLAHSAKGELYASGGAHYPFLVPYLDSLAAAAPVRLLQGHDRPIPTPQDDWTHQSDHGEFHDAHIPYVYFGVEDHPDYHRPSDELRTITPSLYVGAARTFLGAVRLFDRASDALEARRTP